ncbi:MAG: peptidoglycan-binding protein [Polyangiaceae bacterium]|nr:peptidoglycan-binding protein [Polyangiaceae bacterium]
MSTLRIGSKGPEVERLQRLLNVKPPDGDFGPKTAAAVREFQQSHGLVADGVVGPKTWEAIEKGGVTGGGGGSGSTTPTPAEPTPGGTDGPAPQPGSSITIQQLRAIFTQAPLKKLEGYLPYLNSAMTEAQINTKLRKSAFLAQLAHESLEFVYMKEQGGRSYFMRMYDITGNRPKKARELGNLTPGDGARYPGRGPIQVTGKNNYRDCGKALGLDLVNHPELVETPSIAFRASAWFWRSRGINEAADRGDFKRVTRIINGGLTHYEDRLKYYNRALKVL